MRKHLTWAQLIPPYFRGRIIRVPARSLRPQSKSPTRKFHGVGLSSGSTASPWVGVAVAPGVAVTSNWLLTSELVTPIACVGVAIVPNMLRIGRVLRNLLGVQRFPTIPSQ